MVNGSRFIGFVMLLLAVKAVLLRMRLTSFSYCYLL